jgi:hypothetical protein
MALSTPIRIITESTQLGPSDTNVIVSFSGVSDVPITVTLSDAATFGVVVVITRQDQPETGPGTVLVVPPAGQKLNNGIPQLNLNPGVGMRFIFTSDGWFSSLGGGGTQRWLVVPPGSNSTSSSQVNIIPSASNIGSNVIPKNTLYVGSIVKLCGVGSILMSNPDPLAQFTLGFGFSQSGFPPITITEGFTLESGITQYTFSFEALVTFTSSSFIAVSLTLMSNVAPIMQYNRVTIAGSIGEDLNITLYHQGSGPGGTVNYGPYVMSLML